jgi:hypothetical protein
VEASGAARITAELTWAAASFAVDAQTAAVTRELEAAGVRSILLKGPAIAEWLWKGRGIRAYADTDLLIAPQDWQRTLELLRALGFQDENSGGHPRMESHHSYPLARGHENVDLHTTLWGIRAQPETVWRVLSADTEQMRVGGHTVEVLGQGARALHVTLHAAQHGPLARKPMGDLALALDILPEEVWRDALRVAIEVDAADVFATALKHTPQGTALAHRLGVADRDSIDALIRLSQVPLTEGFQELATTPGLRPKLVLLRKELAPSPEFMRWWSPLARRGRLGLALAFVWRPLWFMWRSLPAYLTWRRARRKAARSS